jgi:transcriptional regulator with XRE-family HTH domain
VNNRIYKIREDQKISQEEFANRLGVTKSAISGYETGRRTPTEQMIKSICREFCIEEKWLRTGEGKMKQYNPEDALSEVLRLYNCSEFEANFFRSYFELTVEERTNFSDYLEKIFGISLNKKNGRSFEDIPDTPEELEAKYPPVDPCEGRIG